MKTPNDYVKVTVERNIEGQVYRTTVVLMDNMLVHAHNPSQVVARNVVPCINQLNRAAGVPEVVTE